VSDGQQAISISISFDVDADQSLRFAEPGGAENPDLSALSWGRYGIVRGLPRILRLLADEDVLATFFVPGATVDAHPDAIKRIASAGHELGHHGYYHFGPASLSPSDAREEIERGTEAIQRCVGTSPVGYRAPGWEMTTATFELLCEMGFLYDSSMMGDDRPYMEHVGDRSLLEIPVHWGLDDFPHVGAVRGWFGPQRDPREVFDVWWIEVESAIAEARATSICFHPEVIGRGWTFAPFAQFVRRLNEDPRVKLVRHLDIAHAAMETGLVTQRQSAPN
jgi:peptidoglycan-N-acetylglucosamine deacetylase